MHNRTTLGNATMFGLLAVVVGAAAAVMVIAGPATSTALATASPTSTATPPPATAASAPPSGCGRAVQQATKTANATIAFAPRSDLIDQICDAIEEIIDDLISPCPILEENEQPLPGWAKTALDAYFDSLEGLIAPIQDPEQGPNLIPPDAGMPGCPYGGWENEEWDPVDGMYACITWAEEAQAECGAREPDHAYIGYRLDSIRLTIAAIRDMLDL